MAADTATHCPYCAFQCGMRLSPGTEDGRLEVAGDAAFPVSRGQMCIKGWTAGELLRRPERLGYPQVRDSAGTLRRASWDGALDELAARLSSTRDRYGADAVGVFGSGALTNEKTYLLGKFARVALGTANIDYNGRYCMSSAAAAANLAFGIDRGLPFPVADIARADTVLVWGSNWAETMPPIGQWFDEQRARGGRMIVADPRRTATARRADLHLQMVPGTDLAVALGLLHLAITDNLVDRSFLAERTVGFDDVRRSVLAWPPDRVERVTGISGRTLSETVHALADVPASILLSGRGPEQQSKGVDTVLAFTNLMLALGKIGRPASGYGCLTGQGNGQGGREHGQKADQLPGYRLIEDASDREVVARAWGVPVASLPGKGLSAAEILGSLGADGGVRALMVVGSNVVVASPDARRVIEGLERLDCLAVLDAFPNETTAHADIVLPVTQWAEEDGTVTNLEGRVLRRRRAVAPPEEVRSDLEVLRALAERLGHGRHFVADTPEAVFDELAAVSAGGRADYSGITYDRLDATGGIYWPCPDRAHLGTPRLFAERFAHPDGRARLVPIRYRAAAEEPDEQYPYYFTTGRHREHYNSGAQTRLVPRLVEARPEPRLEIHPQLARHLGLTAEGRVRVESRRGAVTFAASIDADIRPDTVFAPFHWGGRDAANVLTNPALDPISRMPEFKICAVRLTPLEAGA
ncbi:MAG TPA: molybdopterin oxidoreductase family protein [Acidimicrobiales bacterium]|jgi:assimilatory nitrate reductase catalytic subunit